MANGFIYNRSIPEIVLVDGYDQNNVVAISGDRDSGLNLGVLATLDVPGPPPVIFDITFGPGVVNTGVVGAAITRTAPMNEGEGLVCYFAQVSEVAGDAFQSILAGYAAIEPNRDPAGDAHAAAMLVSGAGPGGGGLPSRWDTAILCLDNDCNIEIWQGSDGYGYDFHVSTGDGYFHSAGDAVFDLGDTNATVPDPVSTGGSFIVRPGLAYAGGEHGQVIFESQDGQQQLFRLQGAPGQFRDLVRFTRSDGHVFSGISSDGRYFLVDGAQPGYVLTSDAWGFVHWAPGGDGYDGYDYWRLNGDDLFPDDTDYNVVIGDTFTTGSEKLRVVGNTQLEGNLQLGSAADATNQGDLSAGQLNVARMYYSQTQESLMLYDQFNSTNILLDAFTNSGYVGIGPAATAGPIGGEQFQVVGDAVIGGKLTVAGIIDPTAVIIEDSGGDAAYYEAHDGSFAAPVGPADDFGRLRYNEFEREWEMSTPDTNGWIPIGSDGYDGYDGFWSLRDGYMLSPQNTQWDVVIGGMFTSGEGEKLRVQGITFLDGQPGDEDVLYVSGWCDFDDATLVNTEMRRMNPLGPNDMVHCFKSDTRSFAGDDGDAFISAFTAEVPEKGNPNTWMSAFTVLGEDAGDNVHEFAFMCLDQQLNIVCARPPTSPIGWIPDISIITAEASDGYSGDIKLEVGSSAVGGSSGSYDGAQVRIITGRGAAVGAGFAANGGDLVVDLGDGYSGDGMQNGEGGSMQVLLGQGEGTSTVGGTLTVISAPGASGTMVEFLDSDGTTPAAVFGVEGYGNIGTTVSGSVQGDFATGVFGGPEFFYSATSGEAYLFDHGGVQTVVVSGAVNGGYIGLGMGASSPVSGEQLRLDGNIVCGGGVFRFTENPTSGSGIITFFDHTGGGAANNLTIRGQASAVGGGGGSVFVQGGDSLNPGGTGGALFIRPGEGDFVNGIVYITDGYGRGAIEVGTNVGDTDSYVSLVSEYVEFGDTPAQTGDIRLTANTQIYARTAGGLGDVPILNTLGDGVSIGGNDFDMTSISLVVPSQQGIVFNIGGALRSRFLEDPVGQYQFRLQDPSGQAMCLEMDDGQNSDVSKSDEGRIIYNESTQTFQASMDGNTYEDILTESDSSPWTEVANVIFPDGYLTDQVVVGDDEMAGSEMFRVVGNAVFDDNVAIGTTGMSGNETIRVLGTPGEPMALFVRPGSTAVSTQIAMDVQARADVTSGNTFTAMRILGGLGANTSGTGIGLDIDAGSDGSWDASAEGIGLRVSSGKIDADGEFTGVHILQPALIGGSASYMDTILKVEKEGGTLSGAYFEIEDGLAPVSTVFRVDESLFSCVMDAEFSSDVQIDGKLTVDGYLDPIAVIIDSPTADAFLELGVGDGADLSPPNTCRLVYDQYNNELRASYNGGSYQPIGDGYAGGGLWIQDGVDAIRPQQPDYDVVIGTVDTSGSHKLKIIGDDLSPVMYVSRALSDVQPGSEDTVEFNLEVNDIPDSTERTGFTINTGVLGDIGADAFAVGLSIDSKFSGNMGVDSAAVGVVMEVGAIDTSSELAAGMIMVLPDEIDGYNTRLSSMLTLQNEGGTLGNFFNCEDEGNSVFIIDGDGYVGIGNDTPTAPLDVSGQTILDTLQITGSPTNNGYVLTSDSLGNATWQAPTGGGASDGYWYRDPVEGTLSPIIGTDEISLANNTFIKWPDSGMTAEIDLVGLDGADNFHLGSDHGSLNDVIISVNPTSSIILQSGAVAAIDADTNKVELGVPLLEFGANVSTDPIITQDDDATPSETGDMLLIRAQTCTGLASSGGDIRIRPGGGVDADGSLYLDDGAGNAMIDIGDSGLDFIMGGTASVTATGNPSWHFGAGVATFGNEVNASSFDATNFVEIGSIPAQVGALRLANNASVYWRNAGNGDDIRGIFVDGYNNITVGDDLGSVNDVILYAAANKEIQLRANGITRFSVSEVLASCDVAAEFNDDVEIVGDLDLGPDPATGGRLNLSNGDSIQWDDGLSNNLDVLQCAAGSIGIGENDANQASIYYQVPAGESHYFRVGGPTVLEIDGAEATFSGDVQIDGKLTVDGYLDPIGVFIEDPGNGAFLDIANGENAEISSPGHLRVIYDDTAKEVRASLDGDPFVTVFPFPPSSDGYWSRDAGNQTLYPEDWATDSVVIGANSMAGAEDFRVVGDSRFEGFLEVGTIVPGNGAIRMESEAGIIARNFGDTADITLVTTEREGVTDTNNIIYGNNDATAVNDMHFHVPTGGGYHTMIAGTRYMRLQASEILLGASGGGYGLVFGEDVVDPYIFQASQSSATTDGRQLQIRSQGTIGAGPSHAGLMWVGGGDANAGNGGGLLLSGGNDILDSYTGGTVTIIPGAGSTNGTVNIADASTATQFSIGDDTVDFSSTSVTATGDPNWEMGAGNVIFGGNMELQNDGYFEPENDDEGYIGSDTNRFSRIRAKTVVQGDMGFDDEACPCCGQRFQENEDVVFRIRKQEADSCGRTISYAVPIHADCRE